MAARKKLRWRDRLDEIIPMAASGTHSPLEYRYDTAVVDRYPGSSSA
jgi:hypothetical protein